MASLNIAATPVKRSYNKPLYGNRGEFTLSRQITVPYFSTVMTIPRVVTELKTHEQVAPSLEQTYNLRELYQREIDQERVQKELIDGYLRDSKKLKFFNSLTIALLPKSKDGHIASTFEDYRHNDPAIPHDPDDPFDSGFKDLPKMVFGGVQYSTSPNGLARLRWDMDRVDAVAVDGQHRLRALQKWYDVHKNKSLEDFEKNTTISLIIVLLDHRAGFNGGDFGKAATKTIAREIFTDLNKNARGVDKATEIVLDDRSLISCCVRRLITEQTCCDSDEELPLSLVRWKEPNHRFDQEYYLNSLVHLHLLLESLVDLSPPKDPMDKSNVEAFIEQANERLGLPENGNALVADGIELKTYFKEKYIDENGELLTPLSDLPTIFLPSALSGFDRRFKPWLVQFLTEFRPYKEVLQYARQNSLISGTFAQYLAQPKGHQDELRNELEAAYGPNWRATLFDEHIGRIVQIKSGSKPGEERWAFKSIFQKAMARLLKLVAYDNVHDHTKFGDTSTFLQFFDKLDEAGLLRLHVALTPFEESTLNTFELWTFIALTPVSGKIRVTKRVEDRILATLALWYFGYRLALSQGLQVSDVRDSGPGVMPVDDIVDAFSRKGIQTQWPVNNFYSDLYENFRQVAYLIAGKDNKEDILDVTEKNIARSRILSVVRMGLQPFMVKAPPRPITI